MEIILQSNTHIIDSKILTPDEVSKIPGNGIQWILSCFKTHFNLDVYHYNIHEFELLENKFILQLKPEDLQKIRNTRINNLLS